MLQICYVQQTVALQKIHCFAAMHCPTPADCDQPERVLTDVITLKHLPLVVHAEREKKFKNMKLSSVRFPHQAFSCFPVLKIIHTSKIKTGPTSSLYLHPTSLSFFLSLSISFCTSLSFSLSFLLYQSFFLSLSFLLYQSFSLFPFVMVSLSILLYQSFSLSLFPFILVFLSLSLFPFLPVFLCRSLAITPSLSFPPSSASYSTYLSLSLSLSLCLYSFFLSVSFSIFFLLYYSLFVSLSHYLTVTPSLVSFMPSSASYPTSSFLASLSLSHVFVSHQKLVFCCPTFLVFSSYFLLPQQVYFMPVPRYTYTPSHWLPTPTVFSQSITITNHTLTLSNLFSLSLTQSLSHYPEIQFLFFHLFLTE